MVIMSPAQPLFSVHAVCSSESSEQTAGNQVFKQTLMGLIVSWFTVMKAFPLHTKSAFHAVKVNPVL